MSSSRRRKPSSSPPPDPEEPARNPGKHRRAITDSPPPLESRWPGRSRRRSRSRESSSERDVHDDRNLTSERARGNATAGSSASASERAASAVKLTRPKVKDGQGLRAIRFRARIAAFKRELDIGKQKRGYKRVLLQLQKNFLQITKQYGGEGVLLVGHPNITKQRRELQLDGAKGHSSNSDNLVYSRYASAQFKSRTRQLLTSDVVLDSQSIPFTPLASAPPALPMRSILHSIEDLYEAGFRELQRDEGERIQKIHRDYEENMEAARQSMLAMRRVLSKQGTMDEEEIEEAVKQALEEMAGEYLAKRRAEEGIDADDDDDEQEDAQGEQEDDGDGSDAN